MKYEIISFDDLDHSRAPNQKWCHETFGHTLGEIIYMFYNNSSFEVFEEYKEIIHSIKNKKHLTQKEQAGISKLRKLFFLKSDFDKNQSFFNPLVAIPNNDKYLVHPGRDRYAVLKALGYNSYSFLVCEKDDMKKEKLDDIKSYHTPETILKFNQNNFSTVTVINEKPFEDWI